MSGTSMASSFVSGAAGLLLSIAPNLSGQEVADAMILGAEDLGAMGWDAEYGNGRVNIMGALESPVPGLVEALGGIIHPTQQIVLFLPAVATD
jgi:subtilisin family serine protease